jgi:hypothetical protein
VRLSAILSCTRVWAEGADLMPRPAPEPLDPLPKLMRRGRPQAAHKGPSRSIARGKTRPSGLSTVIRAGVVHLLAFRLGRLSPGDIWVHGFAFVA